MPKLFIESLPRNCTSRVLKNYFRQLTPSLRVRRSKNKGRKTKMWAIIDISSEEDFNRIVKMEHTILGEGLEVKPYIQKSKTPGRGRREEEEVVYEVKSKRPKIKKTGKVVSSQQLETGESLGKGTHEAEEKNAEHSRRLDLGSLQLFCSVEKKREEQVTTKETSNRRYPCAVPTAKQNSSSFCLFPSEQKRPQLGRINQLEKILQPRQAGLVNRVLLKDPLPESYEEDSQGKEAHNSSNSPDCLSTVLRISTNILTKRHFGYNLRFNF